MPINALQLDTTVIYFVYGLSFFTLGLAVFLELSRIPMLAEARILRPLAAFGILHGLHEWIELFMMPLAAQGILPPSAAFIRIMLLTVSFACLFAYGIRAINWRKPPFAIDSLAGLIILAIYFALLFVTGNIPRLNPGTWTSNADILARYLIAVPSAFLAAFALHKQYQRWSKNNLPLAKCFTWAAVGFFLYGLSQVFTKASGSIFLHYLNAESFNQNVGIPIQGLRSILAAIIAISLIRATHLVEQKRQQQLLNAEAERLEAVNQLQNELEIRKKMRRELLRHTVIAQEEERKRIARELHDETAQTLTANSLTMATLQQIIPDIPEAHEIIQRSQELCRSMARGLHRLVHDLRPSQLDDLGLAPSMQHLVDEARKNDNLKINFETKNNDQRIDPLVETVLFRITQEAITNIIRHAQTDHATIRLTYTPKHISLEIHDSGVGFTINNRPEFDGGCGLAGMRERTESVGGEILIASQPGQGTRIEVVIPLSTASKPRKKASH